MSPHVPSQAHSLTLGSLLTQNPPPEKVDSPEELHIIYALPHSFREARRLDNKASLW
jgi:hypothetical protein